MTEELDEATDRVICEIEVRGFEVVAPASSISVVGVRASRYPRETWRRIRTALAAVRRERRPPDDEPGETLSIQ